MVSLGQAASLAGTSTREMVAQDSLFFHWARVPAVCWPPVARSCFAAAVFTHYDQAHQRSKAITNIIPAYLQISACVSFLPFSARQLNVACLDKELSHLLHLAKTGAARAAQRVDWADSGDICVRICVNRATTYDH